MDNIILYMQAWGLQCCVTPSNIPSLDLIHKREPKCVDHAVERCVHQLTNTYTDRHTHMTNSMYCSVKT